MYNNQQAKTPYEHKPGRGSFFNNDRKQKPTDPTFTGSAKLPDGTDVWVNIWQELDQTGMPKQNGQHSIAIKPKDAPRGYAGNPAPAGNQGGYNNNQGYNANQQAQRPVQY